MPENTNATKTRTPLDENLDEMRVMLAEKGVTLESAMQTLWDLKKDKGRSKRCSYKWKISCAVSIIRARLRARRKQ